MDAQSRLDAMADAETLWANCAGTTDTPGAPWFLAAGIAADNLWIARWNGGRSIVPSATICSPDLAAVCGREAAKAAFRAVPGLRGDPLP